MGLRSTLVQLVGGPAAALLEAAVRDVVQESLEAGAFVSRQEVASLTDSIDALRQELATRRSDVEALRQSLEAFHGNLDDELEFDLDAGLGDRVTALEKDQAELGRKVGLTQGALDATADQLGSLREQIEGAAQAAEKARAVAVSARNTAETAADGISELESKLAN